VSARRVRPATGGYVGSSRAFCTPKIAAAGWISTRGAGFFYEPTVIAGARNADEIVRQEV
jgi:acyl-CoA reductase-like NAD-dependent aldehyde dehydrogenase